MDKIMLNKHQNQNSYLKTSNIEVIKDINLTEKQYIIKNYLSYSLGGTDGLKIRSNWVLYKSINSEQLGLNKYRTKFSIHPLI